MSDDGDRGDDGFLARWSRRKRAERPPRRAEPGRGGAAPVELVRATPTEQVLPTAADAQASLPATREQESEEEKARRDLPPVDTLDKDSDYTRFLKKNVPEALKRQALKRLWTSDPQFHVIDPFTEYGGDYTVVVPFDALKDTLYKPGIGYLTNEELEQQKNLGKQKAVAEGETDDEQADAVAAADAAAAPSGGKEATAADAPSPQGTGADDDRTAEDGGPQQADAGPDTDRDADTDTAPSRR
ncbi:MAG: DUF3306 domain-containing protein [Rhodospirillales bacterium]|nr:DUF3306 domain-containing protein [Rhodospirillales bacterium]